MNYAAITKKGLEGLSKLEIENQGNKAISDSFFVSFDCEDIIKLMYSVRLPSYILSVTSKGSFTSFDDLVSKINYDVPKGKTFRVNVTRNGEHSFLSVDVERALAKAHDNVNLDNPDIIARVFIQDNDYVAGLDMAGFDLSKRQYKVFNHPSSLNGSVAIAASLFADFSEGDTFLDPLSFDGSIVIEAALYASKMSVHYFDKKFDCESWLGSYDFSPLDKDILPESESSVIYALDPQFKNLSAMKKNAKIAGVADYLNFAKCDIDDLDIKFYRKAVDLIVTRPLEPSKKVSESFAKEVTSSIFLRGVEFLSGYGRIVFVSKKPDFCTELANSFDFDLVDSLKIYQGKSIYYLLKFVRRS